ncbi:HMA2 domain-containing protein [Desulfonatronum parangueonense]
MYISYVPGRIRIRMQDPSQLNKLAKALHDKPGILDTSINERTGSMLILFEKQELDKAKIESLIKKHLPNASRKTAKSGAKMQYMTIAKRGMLGSLGLALTFALLDHEDAHVASGAAFLGFLGYHLYGYRKRVLA